MYLSRLSSLSCIAKSQVEAMNLRLRLVLLVLYHHAPTPSRFFFWYASLQPCKHYGGLEDTSAEWIPG